MTSADARPPVRPARAVDDRPIDELIASLAVDVPDFPVPGVLFRDLTPVFADGPAFRRMVDGLAVPTIPDPRVAALGAADGHPDGDPGFDVVVGVEARGFLLAAAVALDAVGGAGGRSRRGGLGAARGRAGPRGNRVGGYVGAHGDSCGAGGVWTLPMVTMATTPRSRTGSTSPPVRWSTGRARCAGRSAGARPARTVR